MLFCFDWSIFPFFDRVKGDVTKGPVVFVTSLDIHKRGPAEGRDHPDHSGIEQAQAVYEDSGVCFVYKYDAA